MRFLVPEFHQKFTFWLSNWPKMKFSHFRNVKNEIICNFRCLKFRNYIFCTLEMSKIKIFGNFRVWNLSKLEFFASKICPILKFQETNFGNFRSLNYSKTRIYLLLKILQKWLTPIEQCLGRRFFTIDDRLSLQKSVSSGQKL